MTLMPPLPLLYLLSLLIFVAVLFVIFRRPMYEVMALAFVFIVLVTRRFDLFWQALLFPSTSPLFSAIFAFLVVAVIFEKTGTLVRINNLIVAVVGGMRGGAGYVSLLGSTFMASLSGTGPGNVAATGVFTIPTMIRSGFPAPLAATTEMSSSMLGNIIPPSGIVVLTFGILEEIQPGRISLSNWMVAAYGVGIWFFLQRWLMLWGLCRVYEVRPIPREERPRLIPSLKEGWSALFLPLVIFLPLFLDARFHGFVAGRLGGQGAKAFSSAVLTFTPALAALYAVWIGRSSAPSGKIGRREMEAILRESLMHVVPIAATIYMAYATARIFQGLEMEQAVRDWFVSLGLSVPALVVLLPLFFLLLGMVLPGSSQIAILGGAMIGAFAAMGGNALLLAALLPAMTGALEGMTPPLALGMYVAMGIAGSGFRETSLLMLVYVIGHVLISMVLLAGLLPIPGL